MLAPTWTKIRLNLGDSFHWLTNPNWFRSILLIGRDHKWQQCRACSVALYLTPPLAEGTIQPDASQASVTHGLGIGLHWAECEASNMSSKVTEIEVECLSLVMDKLSVVISASLWS